MRTSAIIVTAAAVALYSAAVSAQHAAGSADHALPAGFETKPVIKTGKTRDNDPIQFPKTDKPEIVSVVGTLQPGGRTPLHQHPVPVYVYILEGELELQTEGAEPHRYKAGEAYIESLNRNHQLFNKSSSPTRLLVVFMGEEGKPTTIASK
jgi:quercetin dioxygenase-like cupin family protein